jgi:hypothetical protein
MFGHNGVNNGRLPKLDEIDTHDFATQAVGQSGLDDHADIITVQALTGVAPEDLPKRARFLAEAQLMTERLAGNNASEAEKVLSRVASSNWLLSKLLHAAYALALPSAQIQTLDHYTRAISRAEKRLSLALRSLSAIRRLDVRLESLRLSIKRESR